MIRKCYHCDEDMTLEEAVEGQIALEKANQQADEFEGWVHCQGPNEQFIQEDDKELQEALKKVNVDFFPYGILVHRKCVEAVFKQETGRDLQW